MSHHDRDALLQGRYGDQQKPANIIWNEQIEALIAHRSVRTFLPVPLPDGALETMVAAAQSASTSSNLHQWSVVAVSAPELKAKVVELSRSDSRNSYMEFMREAPTILLWIADGSRNEGVNAAAAGASSPVLEHLDAFVTTTVDAALASQNAVVAAEAIGLGATYLGVMRNHAQELADLLELPRYSYVVVGLAVGVPDPARQSSMRPRPPQSVVLHHERYTPQASEAWVDDYSAAFHEFRSENNMRPFTWRDAIEAGANLDYLDGRERLRDVVQARGFGLR